MGIPYPTFCGTQLLLWIAGDPGIPTCTRHGRKPFKSWRDKGNFLLSTFNNFENCWLHDLSFVVTFILSALDITCWLVTIYIYPLGSTIKPDPSSSSSSSSQPLTFHTFHQWVPQDAALHSRGLFPIPHPAPTASASAGWAMCPCKPSASGSTTNVQGGPGSASSCGERYSWTQQKRRLWTYGFSERGHQNPSNCMLDRNSKNELSELTMKPSQPQNLVTAEKTQTMAQTPNLLKTPLSYSHCWPVEGVQSYRVILWQTQKLMVCMVAIETNMLKKTGWLNIMVSSFQLPTAPTDTMIMVPDIWVELLRALKSRSYLDMSFQLLEATQGSEVALPVGLRQEVGLMLLLMGKNHQQMAILRGNMRL